MGSANPARRGSIPLPSFVRLHSVASCSALRCESWPEIDVPDLCLQYIQNLQCQLCKHRLTASNKVFTIHDGDWNSAELLFLAGMAKFAGRQACCKRTSPSGDPERSTAQCPELPQGFEASRPRLRRLSPVLKCPRAEFHFGKSRLFAWHCVVLLAGQLQDDRKQNAHGHGICQIRSTILGLMGAPRRPNKMSREG